MKPLVSILVPVFNEESNIEPLLKELELALVSLKGSYEVIVVDDGSTDRSPEILTKFAKEKNYLKVIFFRRNFGQTAAFDAGFLNANGTIIITMDSDLQNDPKDIPRMVELIEQGYDFVAGWRRKRKDHFVLRTIPSKMANKIISRVTRTHLHDLGCSLKAYRKELTAELRLYGEMHRFIGVLLENMGARVIEIEVNHRPRVAGVSKYNLTRTFKVLLDLLTIWFLKGYQAKPSYIFGGLGVSLLSLSGLVTLIVIWEKVSGGVWVHRNPLFMIAVLFTIVGFQFVALGLLAELLIRTYFESSSQRPYSIVRRIGFPEEKS